MCFEQRKSFKWKFANKKTSFSRNTFYGDVATMCFYYIFCVASPMHILFDVPFALWVLGRME